MHLGPDHKLPNFTEMSTSRFLSSKFQTIHAMYTLHLVSVLSLFSDTEKPSALDEVRRCLKKPSAIWKIAGTILNKLHFQGSFQYDKRSQLGTKIQGEARNCLKKLFYREHYARTKKNCLL